MFELKPFNYLLIDLIKSKGVKKIELAEKIEVDRSAITRYVQGISFPKDEVVIKIAEYFSDVITKDEILSSIDLSKEYRDSFKESFYSLSPNNEDIPALLPIPVISDFDHILNFHHVINEIYFDKSLFTLVCNTTVNKSITVVNSSFSEKETDFKYKAMFYSTIDEYEAIKKNFSPNFTSYSAFCSRPETHNIRVVPSIDTIKKFKHKIYINPPITKEDTEEEPFEYTLKYTKVNMVYLCRDVFNSSMLHYPELNSVTKINPTTRKIYTPTSELSLVYILPKNFEINESTINVSVKYLEGLRSVAEKEEKRIKDNNFLKIHRDSENRINICLKVVNPLLFCRYTLDFDSPLLDDLIRSGYFTLEDGKKVRSFLSGYKLNEKEKFNLKDYILKQKI